MSRISVIVPTYRRPQTLVRCLEALKQQTRPAEEVVVAVRDTDDDTQRFLAEYDAAPLPLHWVLVSKPGTSPAQNAALEAITGDIMALTDDDAAPHPDWLARIEARFAEDEHIGGVGGRDWVYDGTENDRAHTVGKVQWWGRVIGDHHLGVGAPREVDVLKGVNCAYRSAPLKQIGFDTRLHGEGAQIHWELSLGLALRRAGWKLIYDPAIAVDHFEAPRFDKDQRYQFNAQALRDVIHNETLVLLEHLPPGRRFVFAVWAGILGTRGAPGLLQLPRLMAQIGPAVFPRWRATVSGRLEGARSWLRYRRAVRTTRTDLSQARPARRVDQQSIRNENRPAERPQSLP